VGNATVFVSAFTASASKGGVPYCPGISTSFFIVPYEQLTIAFRDMAVVNVVPSATSIELYQPLNITVTIRNEGTEVESCKVTTYFGDIISGTLEVEALSPYSEATLNFPINNSQFDVGSYRITVSIPPLLNEADLTDNYFINGVVEIKSKTPIIVHDIKIAETKISRNSLYIGELLQINVTVVNKGTETETFNVSTFFDSSLIKTMKIESLTPSAETTLIFFWNTSQQNEGYYQISASAPLITDINPADNIYIDGVVRLKASPAGLLIHDIAILNAIPSRTLAYIGDIVNITVVVKNLGNYTESFNITLFHDSGVIGKLRVESLNPQAERTLIFHWNTTNMTEGNYLLKAQTSSIPGETNIENNSFIDGIVELVAPSRWFVPEWFYWLLYSLLILIPILLLIMLYRRKRKNAETAFSSGWTAWYYCYNPRNKTFTTNKQHTPRSI